MLASEVIFRPSLYKKTPLPKVKAYTGAEHLLCVCPHMHKVKPTQNSKSVSYSILYSRNCSSQWIIMVKLSYERFHLTGELNPAVDLYVCFFFLEWVECKNE